jgi:polyphenol oxidase
MPHVGAFMTTRHGGISLPPFDSLNLRHGVGDTVDAVTRNQRLLAAALSAVPVALNQVHGCNVVRLTAADALPGAPVHTADACYTTQAGIACMVHTADCLPVLFAAPNAVGAAHAGWRGLALGVLEATLAAICQATQCQPWQVQVWLGACIGPQAFEVGVDVLQAFGVALEVGLSRDAHHFKSKGADKCSAKWLADLPGLARDRLLAQGVQVISGGTWCTVSEPSRFFSFRRDGRTGRMGTLIWIDNG